VCGRSLAQIRHSDRAFHKSSLRRVGVKKLSFARESEESREGATGVKILAYVRPMRARTSSSGYIATHPHFPITHHQGVRCSYFHAFYFLTSTSILMSVSFSCNSARMPSSTTLSIVILRLIIFSASIDPLPSASITRSKSVVV
jgi:hypothetical protein